MTVRKLLTYKTIKLCINYEENKNMDSMYPIANPEGLKKYFEEIEREMEEKWKKLGYRLFTIYEVAKVISCSEDYVLKLISKGYLKALQINAFDEDVEKKFMISRNNLIKYLDSDGKGNQFKNI